MLDLSAAFDQIDHDILFKRLEHVVGLRGTVLKMGFFLFEGTILCSEGLGNFSYIKRFILKRQSDKGGSARNTSLRHCSNKSS